MKENRISLTEAAFTNLCKKGSFIIEDSYGRSDIPFTTQQIKSLIKGEILEIKSMDGMIINNLILQDIGFDKINEILKRSPVYS